MVASPAAAIPLIMPESEAYVRCWDNPMTDAFLAVGACANTGPGNSISAVKGHPYLIDIQLKTQTALFTDDDGKSYYDDAVPRGDEFIGAEVGAAAITKFGIGFVLSQDLPDDFDYDNIKIPYVVTAFTNFINFGGTGVSHIPLDRPEVLLGQSLVEMNIHDGNDPSIVVGLTDLEFGGAKLIEATYTKSIAVTQQFFLEFPILEDVMKVKGDGFVILGQKGAACLADAEPDDNEVITDVGCWLSFDPVVSLNQASFDALMGDKSFALADYFTIVPSGSGFPQVGSAIPEPTTWAMMIGGFGMVGGAMRRSRRNVAAVLA